MELASIIVGIIIFLMIQIENVINALRSAYNVMVLQILLALNASIIIIT